MCPWLSNGFMATPVIYYQVFADCLLGKIHFSKSMEMHPDIKRQNCANKSILREKANNGLVPLMEKHSRKQIVKKALS